MEVDLVLESDSTRYRAAVARALTDAGYNVVSVNAPAQLPAGHPECDWISVVSGEPIVRRPGKAVRRGSQPINTPTANTTRTMVAKQRALTGAKR